MVDGRRALRAGVEPHAVEHGLAGDAAGLEVHGRAGAEAHGHVAETVRASTSGVLSRATTSTPLVTV
ncbi:hypothetical protein IU11_15205 [Cellulosimicrobium sp. MM]|nr:hypothetical protein IU11_15205 [Cellulosimicrobium sp. MM]